MNKFNIKVMTKMPKMVDGLLSLWGKITINDFNEWFVMPLQDWSITQYQKQWTQGLQRIKTHDTSCLVTTVQNLKYNALIEMWTLYKEKNIIFFHHEMINKTILKELNIPTFTNLSHFNDQNCYDLINPRTVNKQGEAVNEDGESICEWKINANEVI